MPATYRDSDLTKALITLFLHGGFSINVQLKPMLKPEHNTWISGEQEWLEYFRNNVSNPHTNSHVRKLEKYLAQLN